MSAIDLLTMPGSTGARVVPTLTKRASRQWPGASVLHILSSISESAFVLCRPGQDDLRLSAGYTEAQRKLTALIKAAGGGTRRWKRP